MKDKQPITEDQLKMLKYLSTKDVFQKNDVFPFLEGLDEVWSTEYKLKVFFQLRDLDLIAAKTTLGPLEGDPKGYFEIPVHEENFHVTQEAKVAIKKYEEEKKEVERKKKLEIELKTSTLRANHLTIVNAATTVIFGVFVTISTVLTCQREQNKDRREARQEEKDSLQQLERVRHDTLYENYLLRKAKEGANLSKSVSDSLH